MGRQTPGDQKPEDWACCVSPSVPSSKSACRSGSGPKLAGGGNCIRREWRSRHHPSRGTRDLNLNQDEHQFLMLRSRGSRGSNYRLSLSCKRKRQKVYLNKFIQQLK